MRTMENLHCGQKSNKLKTVTIRLCDFCQFETITSAVCHYRDIKRKGDIVPYTVIGERVTFREWWSEFSLY